MIHFPSFIIVRGEDETKRVKKSMNKGGKMVHFAEEWCGSHAMIEWVCC